MLSLSSKFVTIGNVLLGSSTSIESSVLNFSSIFPQIVRVSGGGALTVLDSVLANEVISETSGTTLLSVSGGISSVENSLIESSGRGSFGFTTTVSSVIDVVTSSNLGISNSTIVSGATKGLGIYTSSQVLVSSEGNLTVSHSTLQSEAQQNASIYVQANKPPTFLNTLQIIHSLLENGGDPGNISIQSNFALDFNQSKVDAPLAGINVQSYFLNSYDSNITGPLYFGTSIAVGNLYNTTTYGINSTTVGGFYNFGWLFVHVLSSSGQTSIPDSNVTVIDPINGVIRGTGLTNSSGWVKLPVLLSQKNASGIATLTRSYYVVQAQSTANGLISNQANVPTNHTEYYTVTVGPPPHVTEATNFSNLNNVTYPIQYGFAEPQTNLTVYSNAYPIGFFLNGSISTINFNSVGLPGYNFTFVIAYPSNFTSVPLGIVIDGISVKPSLVWTNSTFQFVRLLSSFGRSSDLIVLCTPERSF